MKAFIIKNEFGHDAVLWNRGGKVVCASCKGELTGEGTQDNPYRHMTAEQEETAITKHEEQMRAKYPSKNYPYKVFRHAQAVVERTIH